MGQSFCHYFKKKSLSQREYLSKRHAKSWLRFGVPVAPDEIKLMTSIQMQVCSLTGFYCKTVI
jgi:hypothetical protein